MENIPGFHDLLARARSGDRAATDELLALIRPWIEQIARGHAPHHGPDGSASDFVQAVWLRAWQKLDQFQGAGDETREIIQLRFFEGLSLRQAAQRLGCNHETLRQRFHAILSRLLQELKGRC